MSNSNPQEAYLYLERVKQRFAALPQRYNNFLTIMKQFKTGVLDTTGVIKAARILFAGHRDLLLGFNQFLPAGYTVDSNVEYKPNPVTPSNTGYNRYSGYSAPNTGSNFSSGFSVSPTSTVQSFSVSPSSSVIPNSSNFNSNPPNNFNINSNPSSLSFVPPPIQIPNATPNSVPSYNAAHLNAGEWQCIYCTLINGPSRATCASCEAPKPKSGGQNTQVPFNSNYAETNSPSNNNPPAPISNNVNPNYSNPPPKSLQLNPNPKPGTYIPPTSLLQRKLQSKSQTITPTSHSTAPVSANTPARKTTFTAAQIQQLSKLNFDAVRAERSQQPQQQPTLQHRSTLQPQPQQQPTLQHRSTLPAPSLNQKKSQPAITDATSFVSAVKRRIQPEIYKQFIDLLSKYQLRKIRKDDLRSQVLYLLNGHSDLRDGFLKFLCGENPTKVKSSPDIPSISTQHHQAQSLSSFNQNPHKTIDNNRSMSIPVRSDLKNYNKPPIVQQEVSQPPPIQLNDIADPEQQQYEQLIQQQQSMQDKYEFALHGNPPSSNYESQSFVPPVTEEQPPISYNSYGVQEQMNQPLQDNNNNNNPSFDNSYVGQEQMNQPLQNNSAKAENSNPPSQSFGVSEQAVQFVELVREMCTPTVFANFLNILKEGKGGSQKQACDKLMALFNDTPELQEGVLMFFSPPENAENDQSPAYENDQSQSIPYDQSQSITYDQSQSIPYDQSQSIPYDQSQSIPYDQSQSIPYDQSQSIPYDQSNLASEQEMNVSQGSYNVQPHSEEAMDWLCPNCSSLNKGYNSNCFGCNISKIDAESAGNFFQQQNSSEQLLPHPIVVSDPQNQIPDLQPQVITLKSPRLTSAQKPYSGFNHADPFISKPLYTSVGTKHEVYEVDVISPNIQCDAYHCKVKIVLFQPEIQQIQVFFEACGDLSMGPLNSSRTQASRLFNSNQSDSYSAEKVVLDGTDTKTEQKGYLVFPFFESKKYYFQFSTSGFRRVLLLTRPG